ncbi:MULTISPECIES: isoprenylcysteine carboxylmethyltransferase family protein [Sinorhizobium]|uniref:methyltransferase family protein n=1 Tax=Sinorhizobium TaxID=28105 RepID=UPI000BE7AED8|nr:MULTISPECIES: isoprenylcysteine carboxylmethyltransferase family protein [Sinorhizobium]PDT51396.1 nickel-cobalt-cadmium resistance protein [Sinorhizobium sp. NG07B]POH26047.1 nickel-cobalt-cadmium resistance protein [Sinorhizobium americanum]
MTHSATRPERPFRQKVRILLLWALATAFVILNLVSHPLRPGYSLLESILEQAGTLLVIVGVIGRIWSILYVGGRKNAELVTQGPYSITRNPLYFFSLMAIFGVGLVFGSIMVAAFFTILAYFIFLYTANREAAYLSRVFGKEFDDYARGTPLFWPDFSGFQWGPERSFSPRALRVTVRDALFIVALVPVSEFFEYLHSQGYLLAAVTLP